MRHQHPLGDYPSEYDEDGIYTCENCGERVDSEEDLTESDSGESLCSYCLESEED